MRLYLDISGVNSIFFLKVVKLFNIFRENIGKYAAIVQASIGVLLLTRLILERTTHLEFYTRGFFALE